MNSTRRNPACLSMNSRAFGDGHVAIGAAPVSAFPLKNSPDSSISARIPWYGRVHSR